MPNVEPAPSFVHNPYMLELPAVAELAKLRQWVCWKMELSPKGKPTKVPYQPNGYKASSTNRKHWSDHTDCFAAAYVEGKFDGIGFVFTADDPYVGVDLDKCQTDGVLTPFASEAIQLLSSYTETSPSGTGLHIICRGSLPAAVKTDRIEMYDRGRFFCFTGQQLEGAPETIEPAGEALRALYEEHSTKSDGNGHAPDAVASLELGFELTTEVQPPALKLIALLDDSKFKRSWEHKRTDLKDTSNSGYDLSLCTIAAQAGWTDAELYSLLVAHRRAWSDRGDVGKVMREDYVRRVLALCRSHKPDALVVAEYVETRESHEIEQRVDSEGALAVICSQLGFDISGVIQVGTKDPTFCLEVGEETVWIGTSSALLSADVVRAKTFPVVGAAMPSMKRDKWFRLAELMLKIATVQEPDESSDWGEIKSVIDDYIQKWPPSDVSYSVIEQARPILKDGALGINKTSVSSFMASCSVRTRMTLQQWLKISGAHQTLVASWDADRKQSKGRRYWFLPLERNPPREDKK